MIAPLILVVLSALAFGASLLLPEWGDLVLAAGPSLLASLWIYWRARQPRPQKRPRVVIDGSNVMYWKEGTPRFGPVRDVIARLSAQGIDSTVIFDANAGHLLAGRYMHDQEMARQLSLPAASVLVVSKGTQADKTIFEAANLLRARILSNDRYRDWAEKHPEVNVPGHVIRGGYHNGNLWLDTDAQGAQDQRPHAPKPGKKLAS